MCICVNCHYVDRCITYHAVEEAHQQPHLTDSPDFDPINPEINANIKPPEVRVEGDRIVQDGDFGFEYDVVGCASFKREMGKWSRLRPGELVPT
ncbi:Ycf34 family protein [Leptolyngbya ohadii]|uniref:Ycf34 family protein n=1 Tax=Leptolyngbya ohadii TaxID=1962290 RepID=UPI000B59FD0A|nr:Ycf34 family protein [Leptolyngbya ohadii]